MEFRYDASFRPPAPVVLIRLGAPGTQHHEGVSALLDSGAAISVMPMALIQRLGLRRVGFTEVQGFGLDTREFPVFAAEMTLGNEHAWIGKVISWAESYAILGRDAMNRWRIVLDGPTQTTSVG